MNSLTKSKLAILLSKLKGFEKPKVREEQYTTDSETAAALLWNAYMRRDIDGKIIADLGAGTGILGIGALLLGAKRVYFVDKDPEALKTAKENLAKTAPDGEAIFECTDIRFFDKKVDTIIENPPFGTKEKHADKEFLKKAFSLAKNIYSIHKATSRDFIKNISKNHGFKVSGLVEYRLELKASYGFHKKRMERIKIGIWTLEKEKHVESPLASARLSAS